MNTQYNTQITVKKIVSKKFRKYLDKVIPVAVSLKKKKKKET